MRTQTPRPLRGGRASLAFVLAVLLVLIASGALMWLLTNTAVLLTLHTPPHITLADARSATWRVILRDEWSRPAAAFPHRFEHAAIPGPAAFLAAIILLVAIVATPVAWCWWRIRRWGAGSALSHSGPRRWLRDNGYVQQQTWARPRDLQRLWVPGPTAGRPYLGWTGRVRHRMLAAEPEVQVVVVAPPRSGKSTGYVIPWLLDHTGPALVLSTKRDVHDATIAHRTRLGRVWVYDPFGDKPSCSYTPLSGARTWDGALRTAAALSSAARPEQENAASEFWDREAAILLAPLLHAAALTGHAITRVLAWLDRRNFDEPEQLLEHRGALVACAQLRGVLARDPRNRETTIMSAANLLRAYRYPRVTRPSRDELTPRAFFDGHANTIYVVAAAHHQRDLQPVILALVSSIYETAIEQSRRHGGFDPPLYLLLDEAANIAPVRDLAPWLSQCGDHGITIATSWQSIAQIDHRYGRAERDAILAASTAQLFIPPIADPTTSEYITRLLGEEPVANTSHGRGLRGQKTLTVGEQPAVSAPSLRQVTRGHALLVYRDLPPALVRAPGWYEDTRFADYRRRRPEGRGALISALP